VPGPDYLGTLLLHRTDNLLARLLQCRNARFDWTAFLSQYYQLAVPEIKKRSTIIIDRARANVIALRSQPDDVANDTLWNPLTASPPRTFSAVADAVEEHRIRTVLRAVPANVAINVGYNGFAVKGSFSRSLWSSAFVAGWDPSQLDDIEPEGWRSRPTSAQPRHPPRAFRDALISVDEAQAYQAADEQALVLAERAARPSASSSLLPLVDDSTESESDDFAGHRILSAAALDAAAALVRRSARVEAGDLSVFDEDEPALANAELATNTLLTLHVPRKRKSPEKLKNFEE
jgi:hypothetical protein